ncbi:thioredoxin family protein [Arcticibacter sp.]|uniref:thioredoxin family protein n=1 Tax=Arcticibacter sp. TaxID=1872630 RepID=UPI003890F188
MKLPGNLMRLCIVLFVFFGLALANPPVVSGQARPLDFKDLLDSMSVQPKPVLLLLSTDWCVYCKMQKFHIQRNKRFQKNSSHFYYAQLNAESKEPIKVKGKTYRFLASGESSGVHELAVALGKHNGTLAYPTWVVMDRGLNVLYRHSGVLDRQNLQILSESLIKLSD